MSYRFKAPKVIIDGVENILIPTTLPGSPQNGHIAVDITDGKLKVYNSSKARWVILGDAEDVRFNNTSNGFAANNVQAAIEENSNSSKSSLITAHFWNNGTSSNAWLNHIGSPAPSDKVPFILPFNAKLVGMTFTNASSGVDLDVRVNISNYLGGNTVNRTIVYQLRDIRTYSKTDITTNNSNLLLNAGDKISVYIQDQGTNPNDPTVILYFKTLNETDTTRSEDFSNGLNLTIGPITIILG